MGEVDLNYKLGIAKVKTHFYIYTGLYIALAMTLLVSIFDYLNLPNDASSKLRFAIFEYFIFTIILSIIFDFGFLLLLLLFPNQIWYLTCCVFTAVLNGQQIFNNTFYLIKYGISMTYDEKKRELLKHYKCGSIANIVFIYGGAICYFYIGGILFHLFFLYKPKKASNLHEVRVVSSTNQSETSISIEKGDSQVSREKSSTDPSLENQEGSDPNNKTGGGHNQSPKASPNQEKPKIAKSKKPQKSGK